MAKSNVERATEAFWAYRRAEDRERKKVENAVFGLWLAVLASWLIPDWFAWLFGSSSSGWIRGIDMIVYLSAAVAIFVLPLNIHEAAKSEGEASRSALYEAGQAGIDPSDHPHEI
jgi:hypothetical protein